MIKLSSVLKGGVHLSFGQIASQALTFVRNLIIARVISPADFGIAAAFATTLSLIEMLSNLAAEMLLVQSPDGGEPRLQDTAQLIRAGRGLLNATVIFLLAGPFSHLFCVPQARWAFQCLAIFPLARGFSHLDMNRVQRDLKFGPSVKVDVGSNVLVTLVAVPLALWLRNYSVMLWVLVLQVASSAIGSHLVAKRPYRWSWDTLYAKRIFAFGWPLLINGLLMYGIFEGDCFIIGSAKRLFVSSPFTLTDLGAYSVASALAMGPALIVANVSTSLFLPLLSREQEVRDEFEQNYLWCSQIIALVATMISIPLILVGGWAVVFLYGQKYAAAAGIIGWLAAMWGIRIFRVAPTVAAIAQGDTQNAMFANIGRSIALLGMLLVTAIGGSLAQIAICGVVGELVALMVTVWRLRRRQNAPTMICIKPFTVFAAGMVAAGLAVAQGISRLGPAFALLASFLLVAAAILVMFAVFPSLRRDFYSLIHKPKGSLATQKAALLN